jgi:hypothetical protein
VELRSKCPWTAEEDREIEQIALQCRLKWIAEMQKNQKCTPGHYPTYWKHKQIKE